MLRQQARTSLRAAGCHSRCRRSLATQAPNYVRIVEVGPRDGLQNESTIVSPEVKAQLIDRLSDAGANILESGSFVSPKWVPQMAGTDKVLQLKKTLEGRSYPVLVPNMKGLETLIALLQSSTSTPPLTDEVSIFTATTDSFSRANTNASVSESIERLAPVVQSAKSSGLKVRGYLSMVIDCPFEGRVRPERVREMSEKLMEMGCYEISLGDTTGTGTPEKWQKVIEEVTRSVPVGMLAAHTHDTFGTAVANVMKAVSMGIRTIDSSVAGLGGCPYTPGATGNVATEDVLYALHNSSYTTSLDLDKVVDVGHWISGVLGRPNVSRVGRAVMAKRGRAEGKDKGEKAKL